MKKLYLLLFMLPAAGCGFFSASEKKGFDYLYTHGKGLYVANYGNGDPQRVYIHGNSPTLSPDGTCIAYTDGDLNPDSERKIAILDLEAGKVRILDTACHNCVEPIWSPDGQYLVYSSFVDRRWAIKYVDKDNLHSAVVASDTLSAYYNPTWSADSRKIIAQNMLSVSIFDLDGKVVRTIPYTQMDSAGSNPLSSNSIFLLTGNEDKLVYSRSVDDPHFNGADDPPTAIFVYDLGTGQASRLSPKGFDCWNPVIKGDTVFCSADSRGNKMSGTYRVDLNGEHFRLAYKNKTDLQFAER